MSQNHRDPALKIQLLGSFCVLVDSQPIEDSAWQRRHARQLVKLLALHPRHRMPSEMLAEKLWPESAPGKASNNLNKILFMARRALEPSLNNGADSKFLRRVGDAIELSSQDGLSIDVENFERYAAEALRSDSAETLIKCAELYNEELLADDLYDEDFIHRRNKLSRLYRQVLLKLSEAGQHADKTDEAIEALHELISYEPLNERYHRGLIQLYADTNQRAKALEQYQQCSDILLRELGQEPDVKTRELFQTLCSEEVNIIPTTPSTETTALNVANVDNSTHLSTLAVLPFENRNGSEKFDYLSEGIADYLTVSLSHLPKQRVLARTTMMRYQQQSLDPFVLRQELSVSKVVCGRFALHGEWIQLWIEVLDTRDGVLLWAQQYEQVMQDIVKLQSQIADDLLSWFRSDLQIEAVPELLSRLTENSNAYHDYLKGRHYWNKRTGRSLESARQYFQSAIDRDPVYAQAYAGLADTYNVMSLFSSAEPHDTMPKARAAAKHALAIDKELCEAHTSLAYCLVSYDWLWQEAESAFKRALSINPNYATTHQWYHKLLVATGRFDEARDRIAKAKSLDPLSVMINTEEGWGLYYSHEFERAVNHLQSVLQDEPNFALARCLLGLAQTQLSQFDQSIKNLIAAGESSQNPVAIQAGGLGYCYAMKGQTSNAKTLLQKLDELTINRGGAAYARAQIFTGLGDTEAALSNLELAFAARLDRLIFLPLDPVFTPLHQLPRMQSMIQQLDLLTEPA